MTNNKKISIFILAVFLLTLVGAGLYFFVLKKSPGRLEENLVDMRQPTGPTGLDLIQKDFEEKRIDFETALIYKMYYLFGEEKLPPKYHTESMPFEDDGLLEEVTDAYARLSPATRLTIEPFLRRPDDPESYFGRKFASQDSGSTFHLTSVAYAYERLSGYKEYVVTADGKIKVWYPGATGKNKDLKLISCETTAKQIVANLNSDRAYAKYRDFLQTTPPSDGVLGGDDKLDIYVVPASNPLLKTSGMTAAGVNVPDSKGKSSFVLIRNNLSPKGLKSTTVHEIFHAFQRRFVHQLNDRWWTEGTAVWSEDFIYPLLNTEQDFVKHFIPLPEEKLYRAGQFHEYGAYLFPFYLGQALGEKIIPKIFRARDSSFSMIEAIDTTVEGGFNKHWREFTLWNINETPARLFKDKSGSFPEDSSSNGKTNSWIFISELESKDVETQPLDILTAGVLEVFNQDAKKKIRRIEFADLTNFTSSSEGASIKAIIYPNKEDPYVEDWTDKEKRTFCLDNSLEDFTRVALIFSNADLEKKLGEATIKVTAKPSCYQISHDEAFGARGLFIPGGLKGTVFVKAEGSLEEPSAQKENYSYQGKWKLKIEYQEDWPPFKLGDCSVSRMVFNQRPTYIFDLSSSALGKDSTFKVQLEPGGQYDTPGWKVNCGRSFPSGGPGIALPSAVVPFKAEDFTATGKIYDMTEEGAKIVFISDQLLNSGYTRIFDNNKQIVFEIKKAD